MPGGVVRLPGGAGGLPVGGGELAFGGAGGPPGGAGGWVAGVLGVVGDGDAGGLGLGGGGGGLLPAGVTVAMPSPYFSTGCCSFHLDEALALCHGVPAEKALSRPVVLRGRPRGRQ